MTAFIVEPKKYPGYTANPIDTMGLSKAFRSCALFLDDFVVPVENRLGEEGEGFKIIMRALETGRIVRRLDGAGHGTRAVSRMRYVTPTSGRFAAALSGGIR